MQALSIMVAVLVGRPLTAQAQPGFLDPTGEFEVGRLEIDITDASRDEVFTEDPADKRRLLVTVYYPAVAADGALSALYGTPELAAALPFFDNERRGWVSSAYVDVPVADGRFPVLVFSPGLDSSTLFYTSLLSELASRGFVVAALWHPYSTDVVAFPDGTVLTRNPAGGMGGGPLDQQAVQLTRLGEIWVADQRFVLDQLAVWNEQHALLRGRLDLQRVGALGHSLGGAAAVEAARVDERIEERFAFVPTFEVVADVSVGYRMEIMSYLVGSSVDGGKSWRFLWFDTYSGPGPSVIDLVSAVRALRQSSRSGSPG